MIIQWFSEILISLVYQGQHAQLVIHKINYHIVIADMP